MENVVICSPYSPCSEYRVLSRYVTDKMYSGLGCNVYYGSSSTENFNRSAAKNIAVLKALQENRNADVIVLADSDTFVSEECLAKGIELCRDTGRLVNPFTVYKWVTHNDSLKCSIEKIEHPKTYLDFTYHVGGIVIVPVELFKKVGGYDERFESWGGEDRAFYFACNAILGHSEGLRVEGIAYHLYHPRDMDTLKTDSRNEKVVQLGMRYKKVSGVKRIAGILGNTEHDKVDVDGMVAIMSEPGGPLSYSHDQLGKMCTDDELNKSVTVVKRKSDGKLALFYSDDQKRSTIMCGNNWVEVLCT